MRLRSGAIRGSILNVVTKSGGSSFHGSVHEFLRNDELNAKGYFDPAVPDFKQNEFGGMMKKLATIIVSVMILAGGLRAADDSKREAIYGEKPEYPPIAIRMNLHGTVRVKVWISSDGQERRLEYIGWHPLLAESALKALKNRRYQASAK